MDNSPEPQPVDPAMLRYLRLLVTILTGTMIAGVLVIIFLLVTRFADKGPDLPEAIELPGGASAQAFTQGRGWFAVVTDDDRILIYDRVTGQLQRTVQITQDGS
ncbi:MAG: DUF6476 family protein [Pseudomonadota bacterium]|uniref:DUF6476 family protein n=1 Tax=Roseovarius TaxID=74030 RepID=UPI0022A8228E|nr:DUF6476 family protein [Roseovarius sp. EGI FJ00037]MCZ0813404.1 DUF6476 family protein [Roseovarius sp. EGI FJ00037]